MLISSCFIIDSIFNFIGGLFSNQQQAKENQRNREWSEYMWNLNNQYNLPVNVMQRYDDAGLNRNLIYSSGTGAGSLSSYAGNLGTDNSYKNPAQGSNILGAYSTIKELKNQTAATQSTIRLNASQENKNNEEALKAKEEAAYTRSQKERQDIANQYAKLNEIADLIKKGLDNSAQQLTNIYLQEANPLQIQQLKETIDNLKKDGLIKDNTYNLISAEIETEGAKKALIEEEKNTEKAKQSNLLHQAAYYDELGLSEHTKRELMKAEATNQYSQAVLNQTAAELNKALVKKSYYERKEIASRIVVNRSAYTKNLEDAGLSRAQALKAITETEQAVLNGEVDRYVKTVPQRYGTSAVGAVFNFILDVVHSSFAGMTYSQPQNP